MKILGNSVWGLNPHQKYLLYRSCVLPIAFYRFQLWYYNCALLSYPLKILGKMQRRATIWILGVFKTFSSFCIEAIAGLISINLYLQKLCGRLQLWAHSLPLNHIIRSLMEPSSCSLSIQHSSSLGSLTRCQHGLIKDHLVDTDNRFNEVFSSFIPLHPEFSSGNRVINIFSNCFSFNLFSKQKDDSLKICIY